MDEATGDVLAAMVNQGDQEDAERQQAFPVGQNPVFTGSVGEYFKIWIVNVILTLVTLGFYTPWAKVRTRRYFYLNTRLAGDPFDYLADPKRLLIGYLILVGFLVCYNFLPTINPILALPVMLIGMIGFPWVLYKSRRFFCHNSSYRNLRFRFTGTLGESYAAYLGIPILMIFTLGLGQPYALFRQKAYFFKNVSFGGQHSTFTGEPAYFFKVYYAAFFAMLGVGLLAAFGIAGLSFEGVGAQGEPSAAMIAPIFLIYFVMFIGIFFITALITNYCWNNMTFDKYARFQCTLHPLKYAWIQISNVFLSALTLGLLIPWASVRMYRYRMECMQVELHPEVAQLIAEKQDEDDGAFGDMAADEFDFEIGL